MFDAHADSPGSSLDPQDWEAFRAQGHRMLDDMVDFMAGIRDRPVWQAMNAQARAAFDGGLPKQPQPLEAVYGEFQQQIQPYIAGNIHPRFLGWVQGGGNPVGVLAEMLAASMNANLGGRDHAPIAVERQVIRWSAEMLGFPGESSGILVTGASMANLIAVLVARTEAMGVKVRQSGLGAQRLVAYTSSATHHCVARAMDIIGLGTDALRVIATNEEHSLDLSMLEQAVAADRVAGLQPFLVVGSAGTVDTGAIDDLASMARFCQAQGLWFHVDAALGGVAMLSPTQRMKLAGLSAADSVAFDYHKWAQVPYDVGAVLVRDARLHCETFSSQPNYLTREVRGLAAGHPWPTDFGPDLSRGFRALKVWMTLKTYGSTGIAAVVDRCCRLAQLMEARIRKEPELQLLSPAALNIVCFRFVDGVDPDSLNTDIVIEMQESGLAVPSTTRVNRHTAIRCAFVNHRTLEIDVNIVIDAVLATGRRLAAQRLRCA